MNKSYTLQYPLDTGGMAANHFALAISPYQGDRTVVATCTNSGDLANQSFRLSYKNGRIGMLQSPAGGRDGALIVDSLFNPAPNANEIWRLMQSSAASSAACFIEVVSMKSGVVGSIPVDGDISQCMSFEFTQDCAFLMATADGLNLTSIEVRSRRKVDNAPVLIPGLEGAAIWRASYYADLPGPHVRTMNTQEAFAIIQALTRQSPPEGHLEAGGVAVSTVVPAHASVCWVGQDPYLPRIWGLLNSRPGVEAVELVACTTEGLEKVSLITIPYDGYAGAMAPCANPATGALQFIDPRNGKIICVDTETATASALTYCPLDPYSAVMRCDADGGVWVVGNHPQKGPMLWAHLPD